MSCRTTAGVDPEGWCDAKIGSLTASLRQAEAERDEARDDLADFDNAILRKFDVGAAESTDLFTWIKCKLSALATERAAREEAEKLAVWAVRHGASEGYDGNSWPCVWYTATPTHAYEHNRELRSETMDATDAGILAALRRAMKGAQS